MFSTLRLFQRDRAQVQAFLDELDLTYTQYIAMMVLWEHRQISVKDMGALYIWILAHSRLS